ncbi:uncharacterized protein LOC108046172 [Drosophila rhopaloa]|uniref:Uncharacterized protein LOC108046172 n=1 Tax=Drosophila rhopaloa TaxID=1041015 RepID=A0A6P4F1N6_DRORH|nr:uncharacterized protein LOC108046172 [Drosophila rhopaloa]
MNRGYLLLLIVCAAGISDSMGFPQDELIKPDSDESESSGVGFVTLDGTTSEESDESGQRNASDDLIFLTHKKPSPSNNSIDLSAFVALIPVRRVQIIAKQYYFSDEEFQRAYTFLSSSYFATIKRKILQLPEVLAFTNYMSDQGLDVVKVVHSVAEVFTVSAMSSIEMKELQYTGKLPKGLHGMVERVLEILPQDQLNALFFDYFLNFFENISSPKFAKIMNDLKNSLPLRNFLFVLHNNSIFVPKIVESVKSYLSIASY